MPIDPQKTTYFKQARFTTRLPNGYLYAPSHYWLSEEEPGLFRIGMTRFATRMLGDFVEISFHCQEAGPVACGDAIGEIEGFKAISEIYCAASGEFVGGNPALLDEPELLDIDPYQRGWIYAVRGRPGDDALDVEGYIGLLNVTIDKMLAQQQAEETRKC